MLLNLIFTQSVGYAANDFGQGIVGGKGMRCESSTILSVYASKFLYPSAKAGHWGTEKAGYEDAEKYFYMA